MARVSTESRLESLPAVKQALEKPSSFVRLLPNVALFPRVTLQELESSTSINGSIAPEMPWC